MTKTRIVGVALALSLLAGIFGLTSVSTSSLAAPEELRWTPVNVPTEGKAGNWQLASGSDIAYLAAARDGTLYAYANPAGTTFTLFKSTDGGYRWSYTGQVTDAIVAIAAAPDDANIIYYATNSTVYKSLDAGSSFSLLAPALGGAGSNNITITSLAVAPPTASRIIAVGTRDNDGAQYGGVYILDESGSFAGWGSTNIGNYDVSALVFSPNYANDRQLIAVATDETNTLVTGRSGNLGWGAVTGNVTIKNVASRKATIVFPDDYDSAFFISLDTGSNGGDVYRIERRPAPDSSIATDLNAAAADGATNIDVSGLVVSGNATGYHLLAGAATNSPVYFSTDGGQTWAKSQKEPTGQSKVGLLRAPDFARSRRVYAGTSGAGSAFSYTSDDGNTWNQLSLIDTQLSQIIDMVVSPKYGQDSTLFLLTWGGEHSLWRSGDGGAHWERIFTGTLAGATALSILKLFPQYGAAGQAVFLAGRNGAQWGIWKSKDNGQTFARRLATFTIDALVAADDDNLFVGSYNGTSALVYGTPNGGSFYSAPVAAGNQRIKSIVLSSNFTQDRTLLLGNANGWVYWSADNGTSFEPLPPNAATPPLTGNVFVAFDPDFGHNRIIYAASDAVATSSSKQRLYRFTIGKSNAWESIDATLPVGSILSQLATSPEGALFAANSMVNGGMERSLNPDFPLGPAFETVTGGLSDNATLVGLWFLGSQLWSVDTRNSRLLTLVDSLAVPVTLTSPGDRAPGLGITNVKLDWQSLKGATKYHWQVDDDANFASVSANFEGDTEGSSTPLPLLEMGTTYYWRVRATEPVFSPWSVKRSFTTALGKAAVAPELYNPKAGATAMPRKPVFQWSALADAERYELLVSANVSFAEPIISRTGDTALTATAWQSDVNLDYDTTYYWKLRGTSAGSFSAWSAVGAFTTEAPSPQPKPPSAPAPPISPPQTAPQVAQQSPPPVPVPLPPVSPVPTPAPFPAWTIYLGLGLLLAIVLLLVGLLVLFIRTRRP